MERVASSRRVWIMTSVLGVVLGAAACASSSLASTEREALTVHVHMSGHPGVRDGSRIVLDTLSFEILFNGVQVVDTTFLPMLNVTGHLHTRVIRVAPGTHRIRVIDRRTSTRHEGRLRTRDGPMWVHVRFVNEGAVLSTGYGFLEFL